MKRRIGLYGGTFDPIHLGHINLILEMKRLHHLDEVWIIPTGVNPFKLHKVVTLGFHRMAMAHLAAEGLDGVHVLSHEIEREGISYATDTLSILKEEAKKRGENPEFFIILGEDAAKGFHLWKDPKKVLDDATILIGPRHSDKIPSSFTGDQAIDQVLKQGWTHTSIKDISSTEIKKKLRQGESCEGLLSPKVLDYIRSHGLYSGDEK